MRKLLAVGLLAALALAAPARAVDKGEIDKAIERGVEALRALQNKDNGTWPRSASIRDQVNNEGPTALAGLTLLECDVKPDDPAVERAADYVRKSSIGMTRTYSIATSILFLDRLGDLGDVPLIESLMVRLLAGQDDTGGWSYDCPAISEQETRRLTTKLEQRKELRGSRELTKPDGERRTVKDLPEEIRQQLQQIDRGGPARPVGPPGVPVPMARASDNSNTQFATLALWVGRKHGLPVDKALARVERRFRTTQLDDGGWSYKTQRIAMPPPYGGAMAAMTCAGILSLAIADGATLEAIKDRNPNAKPPDLRKDAQLVKAVQTLSAILERPGKIALRPGFEEDLTGRIGGWSYYFLWSVERVAVALDLQTIGRTDWYGWGAERLLASQRPDGSWHGGFADCGADTCFALLFLKRANLARDLTAHLKGRNSERVLRGVAVDKPLPKPSDIKPIDKPLPPREADPAAVKLADDLVKAGADRQAALIQEMQDGRGGKYTEALAAAIPKLEGDARKKAREALADRLSRMKDETLADYLRDDLAEVRRAAALAVAMKESKALVPGLIGLLRDDEADVARAAHAALKSLTGQDFGPAARASRDEREQAARKWAEWWQKQKK